MHTVQLSGLEARTDIRHRLLQPRREWINTWILRVLVAAGCLALGTFFSWWFVNGRLHSPWMWLWLILAVFYAGTQMVGNWILYLLARREVTPAPPGAALKVDVFVTACREPYEMIERSLTAACSLRGAHRTWLLDDGSDPGLTALTERLGAGYLTRPMHQNAKAGNLNAALSRTEGEIIAIFDIDHVPEPGFLEKSLGYFSDPRIGFVQVMLTFDNSDESWVARAAMETSLEFYNPTYLGTAGVGGASMMGSNALIRRSALEAIGGYRAGLAEDLATSIALHAAGWKSAYVAEPLAPGQAPPSFTAWFVQQLKWARGVFELLLTSYPRLFPKLTWGQRLSYAVRMTKYWIGPVVGMHLFATVAVLIFADAPFRDAFHDYLIYLSPLVGCDVLIRYIALQTWKHPSIARTSLTRAVSLVYATWPIYMVAWLMAILRLPLPFRPTPKGLERRTSNPIWLLPQGLALALLTAGILYTIFVSGHQPSILVVFAILQGILQLALLYQWLNLEMKTMKTKQHYGDCSS
jgi:cellulose synthase/poly-beta-1,6-N-acetylglucosamine synthase-like glycosyltransferase